MIMRFPTLLLLAPLALALIAGDGDRLPAREELRVIAAQLQAFSRALELVHEVVAPSVVSIHTSDRVRTGRGREREVEMGEGSGFIVQSGATSSFVLTNFHVVYQGFASRQPVAYDRLRVVLSDNREIDAEYVAYDRQSDLAVLRIPIGGLAAVEWADSDKAHVGQVVMALGYPFGVGYSASQGIISATDRSTGIYSAVGGLESFIQTDAAVNPGNSGGPLVDLHGRILGVNANIVSRSGGNMGLGFAIPGNLARRVADDLIRHRAVRRPVVGVQLDDLAAADADRLGLPRAAAVSISQVIPLTPAATAGLRVGDVILSVNGQRITSVHHFRALVAAQPVERPLTIRVWRDRAELTTRIQPITAEALQAHLEQLAAREPKLTIERFGFTVTAPGDGQGLRVVATDPGQLGQVLVPGDRLISEQSLGQLDRLADAEPLRERRVLTLVVRRGEAEFTLRLRK